MQCFILSAITLSITQKTSLYTLRTLQFKIILFLRRNKETRAIYRLA